MILIDCIFALEATIVKRCAPKLANLKAFEHSTHLTHLTQRIPVGPRALHQPCTCQARLPTVSVWPESPSKA